VKTFIRWTFRFGLVCLLLIIISNYWISEATKGKHFIGIEAIPTTKTALVLGTSPKLSNGQDNLYFTYRMRLAAELYKQGKVTLFVLSGDNHSAEYDEPEAMRLALIELGVPDSVLHLDYAGFRTLDSVVRLKAIFGQDSALVVSQKFHNERAIFIGANKGIHLIGANAQDVSAHYGLRTQLREYLARVKCCIDLYILHKEPHFYGEQIPI